MASTGRKLNKRRRHSFFSVASVILILSILASLHLVGCSPRAAHPPAAGPAAVDYTPLPQSDWEVSTPEELVLLSALSAGIRNELWSLVIQPKTLRVLKQRAEMSVRQKVPERVDHLCSNNDKSFWNLRYS